MYVTEFFPSIGILSRMLDLFDTPAVIALTVFGTHRDQLFQLCSSAGLPRATFPALTSLSTNSSELLAFIQFQT